VLTPLNADDPRSMGPYQVAYRIGAGEMGVVYLGLSTDARPAAVRVLSAALADDPRFRARLRDEVRAAWRLQGSSVAAVLDADVHGQRPCIATEYIEGRSLAATVAERGSLDERLVLGLAIGLADALLAVHRAGVVHPALKPADVLLASDGPKVVDVGITRPPDSVAAAHSGTLVGTLVWMAPEQLRGDTAPSKTRPSGTRPSSTSPATPATARDATRTPSIAGNTFGLTIPTSTTPAPARAGYATYHDATGWSVALPTTWRTMDRGNGRLLATAPGGRPELVVEVRAKAGQSAIDAWYALEPAVRAQTAGYTRLSIRPADGGTGIRDAIWEFTYTFGGHLQHVLDLGVVRNGHGYGMRWTVPADRWQASLDHVQTIATSFRPGP
jgi:hypothetical protein